MNSMQNEISSLEVRMNKMREQISSADIKQEALSLVEFLIDLNACYNHSIRQHKGSQEEKHKHNKTQSEYKGKGSKEGLNVSKKLKFRHKENHLSHIENISKKPKEVLKEVEKKSSEFLKIGLLDWKEKTLKNMRNMLKKL